MKRIPVSLTEKEWLRICALLMVRDAANGSRECIALSSKIMAQLGDVEE
jgi:hypothetical protein